MTSLLLGLGFIFILGLFAYWLGTITALPRVTLLIFCGLIIGPSGFNLLADVREIWFEASTTIALIMVGFLIGGSLNFTTFKAQGKAIVSLSMGVVIVTFLTVAGGLLLFGAPLELAVLLAAIATATDPAAIQDVIKQNYPPKKASYTLFGIVALDDAWGLLLFSLCLTFLSTSTLSNGLAPLTHGLIEVLGSIILGVCIGLPMAYLSGRIHEGEPTLIEALGLVFIAGGLALKFELSYILTAIAMGATVSNLASHHTRPFQAIEDIEAPFLIMFFILAGASLNMGSIIETGLIGLIFIGLRLIGKLFGGYIAGAVSGIKPKTSLWMGFALLPQAGVAIGIALISGQLFPNYADIIINTTIAATIIFELFGPIATRKALENLD